MLMEKEVLEKYQKAQEINKNVSVFSKDLIKEGASAISVAEKIDAKIKELGGKAAFPVNISVNDVAAHYTPEKDDTLVFKADDLVKVDIGVHVDGYISDRAFTVCIGKKSHPLIDASEKGLKAALKLLKPGVKVFEISEAVESTIANLGFNPIRNLCGHGLMEFNQHAPPTIPNGRNSIKTEIPSDYVIAMEVFTTDGGGWVKESDTTLIFSFIQDKPIRLPEGRKILQRARDDFKGLPFTKRWFGDISSFKLDMAFQQLLDVGALRSYPVLREETGGSVAQTEDTVILD